MSNSNHYDCKYLGQSKYCVHKNNKDIRKSPSTKGHRLKRKRCLKKYCPLEWEH